MLKQFTRTTPQWKLEILRKRQSRQKFQTFLDRFVEDLVGDGEEEVVFELDRTREEGVGKLCLLLLFGVVCFELELLYFSVLFM